jgi:transcriptional regulator with XRE-family HTH domain
MESNELVEVQAIQGAKIKYVREELGYTRYKVAKLCGINQDIVKFVEEGERNYTHKNFINICDALGIEYKI